MRQATDKTQDRLKEVGDDEQATVYLVLAEREVDRLKENETKKDNYLLLYEFFKELGDYKRALQVYENYNAVKDSLFSAERNLRLVEVEKKYHGEKMKREFVEVKAKEQKKEALLWGLLFFFIFL